MTTYGMIIDLDRCNGCYSCFLSCRDEYCGNDYPPYSASQPQSGHFWMNIKELERGSYPKMKVSYIPTLCQQCENAPCEKAATDGAVYRRPDGVVIIDPEKAKGQKDIVSACPYRVIYWNDELELPQKCTFCVHGLEVGWKKPRCVESCPSDALVFGDLDDPDSDVSKLKKAGGTELLNPEFSGQPKVLYKDIPKRFAAGEIILVDKQDVCAEGIAVTLKDGGKATVTKTDVYGDFEFTGLDEDKNYTVSIELAGYGTKEYRFRTKIDVNLGEIVLEPNP